VTSPAPVSVVVLTARRAEKLARCLRSLAEGTRAPAEVVVVVSDATDETRDVLYAEKRPFELVAMEGPGGGYAEARNAGVRASSQPLVAMLDDDCYADRFWIERMAAALADCDIVGGVALPAEQLSVPRDFHPELNWIAGLSPPSMWAEDAGRRALPTTSNMAFRRALHDAIPFQEIGGSFSGRRHTGYAVGREDAQWWSTQRDAGAAWRVDTRAIVWHDIPKDRFGLNATRERAAADGRAHWKRARPKAQFAQAASDVVHLPFRAMRDSLSDDATPAEPRRLHATWAARQKALLDAAASDMDEGISPQTRAAHYVREGARAVLGEVKPLARAAAAFGHHAFKNIRPLPQRPEDLRRLAIVQYDDAADAILMQPMLAQLREAAPQAELVLVGGPTAASIHAATGVFDEIVALPGAMSRHHPAHAKALFDAMRKAAPDAIVAAYCRGPLPMGIFAATDAPVACWDSDHGFGQEVWKDLASARVPRNPRQPEIAALLNLLAPFGIATRLERPRWAPSEVAIARACEVMEKVGIRRGEFAAWTTNAHDAETLREAVLHAWEHRGLRAVFVGPREGRGAFEALELPAGAAVSLHGMLDAAQTGALLSDARVVVAAEGDATQLAQAVSTPTLVVFEGAIDARRAPMARLASDGDRLLPFRAIDRRYSLAAAVDDLLAESRDAFRS